MFHNFAFLASVCKISTTTLGTNNLFTTKYDYLNDILLHTIKKEPMYLNKTLHRFLVNIEDSYLLNKKDIAFIVDKEGRGGDNLESIFRYLYEYIVSKRFEFWNKHKLNY